MKKTLIAAVLMTLSFSAAAYQPPVYINQIGNSTVISQPGRATVYCHTIGNSVVCN